MKNSQKGIASIIALAIIAILALGAGTYVYYLSQKIEPEPVVQNQIQANLPSPVVVTKGIENLRYVKTESGNPTKTIVVGCQALHLEGNVCTVYSAQYMTEKGVMFSAQVEIPKTPLTKEAFLKAVQNTYGTEAKGGDYLNNNYYGVIRGRVVVLMWYSGGNVVALKTENYTNENGDRFEDLLSKYLPLYPSELSPIRQ
jgi:hypothetical protein